MAARPKPFQGLPSRQQWPVSMLIDSGRNAVCIFLHPYAQANASIYFFTNMSAGQMLVNVSSNEDYVLAAIYTNASSPSDTNFNYFLGVYPQQSKGISESWGVENAV